MGEGKDAATKVAVHVPIPSTRILKLAALVCFLLDVFGGALGIGARFHLTSLGLALYVADDVITR